jgi:hypothetical protein
LTVLKQLKTKISEIATVLLCPLELFSKDSENDFAGKEKQGPMEEIGPCRYKGDHLRIIAKSQW